MTQFTQAFGSSTSPKKTLSHLSENLSPLQNQKFLLKDLGMTNAKMTTSFLANLIH